MNKTWFWSLLTASATMVLGSPAPAQVNAPALRVGEPFPNLLFPAATDGRPVSLHHYHGRKTLVHLFASW